MEYFDCFGYLRDGRDGVLIHRKIAYEKIYCKNPRRFELPFSCYVVHHKDRNKLNNDVSNLEILTEEEHAEIHLFDFLEPY